MEAVLLVDSPEVGAGLEIVRLEVLMLFHECVSALADVFFPILAEGIYQLDLFTDYEALSREKQLHAALLEVRTKYGANALLKGLNLLEGATTKMRNEQIGEHRA